MVQKKINVYNSACVVSLFFLRFHLSIDDVAFEGGKSSNTTRKMGAA
jgi:hypothetical protein